jgi:redox-sensitive bicupin YhaK (pirin superfamily)
VTGIGMNLQIRKSEDRGHVTHGWLLSKHTFAFGVYYDNRHLGYRDLRVINEDVVEPGEGFPPHPHKSMEILTYVLEGQLEHRDSLHHHGVIGPGEVQYMSAGTGVTHSEFNHSKEEPVHFLQIWIRPEKQEGPPIYGQTAFTREGKLNRFQWIASPDGREGSFQIRQNVTIRASILEAGHKLKAEADPSRFYWVQVARGEVTLNGTKLETGDGASLSRADQLEFSTGEGGEFLLFDLN